MAFLRKNRASRPKLPTRPEWSGKRTMGTRAGSVMGLLTLIAVFLLSLTAYGTGAQSREYLVKAAFLYNFAKFVEWPNGAFADQSSPLFLCILGRDPFGEALETIKGKRVMGREIVIKRYEDVGDIPASGCNIVFISSSESKRLPSLLRTFEHLNVLTVSDMDGFARRGGIIGLITVKNKIRFEINVDAAERSHLRISSKLLRLSSIVRDGEEFSGN